MIALSNAEMLSDAEVVQHVQEGEKEAFAVLVRRHEKTVYWIVQGILQNEADAEEVLQETFLKALAHIRDFRGESRFSTWLVQIAMNEARMRRRKYRVGLHDSLDEKQESDSEPRPRELPDWRPNPEQQAAKKELRRLVHQAIRGLPARYREVILLREVQRLSSEQAAEILQLSVPGVKSRLLRARLLLRDALEPHFKQRWHERVLARVMRRGS